MIGVDGGKVWIGVGFEVWSALVVTKYDRVRNSLSFICVNYLRCNRESHAISRHKTSKAVAILTVNFNKV